MDSQEEIRIQQAIAAQETINAAQAASNDGQKKINGELCRVDWMIIETLKHLRQILDQSPAMARADFENFDKWLKWAYYASGAVADIKPPGCEPSLKVDPDWTVKEAA